MKRERPWRAHQSLGHEWGVPHRQQEDQNCREEHDDAGAERIAAEVFDQLPLLRLQGQEHRREEGEERQREGADSERERREPRLHEPLREGSRGGRHHPAARHGPDADPEQQRGEHAGAGEDPSPASLRRVVLVVVGAKGEGRAPEHDSDQHQRDGNVEHGHDPGEHRREAGEREHHGEDQPDVVRFPDGPDGVRDHLPLPDAPRPAGEHVPHAAAEIRPAQQHVGVERERQKDGEEIAQGELRHRPSDPGRRSGSTRTHGGSEESGGRAASRRSRRESSRGP